MLFLRLGFKGDDPSRLGGSAPVVGHGGQGGSKSGSGKKKNSKGDNGTGGPPKDPDGAYRVPGFRGVWVLPSGKHFVKVDGKRMSEDGTFDTTSSPLKLFDITEDAAREFDEAAKKVGKQELNFKDDGSRTVYEDFVSSVNGLGGSASTAVPALSVINIKVWNLAQSLLRRMLCS